MPWIDREMYPFESHTINVPDGQMHYVDEGEGEVLLMLHGTPTWSFLYRHLIKGLSGDYRVIAPDLLGFGLSDNPESFSYRPVDHARNIQAFIEALNLRDITLVVHDFGGSIGLSYALDHPDNVPRIVLFNTWMWSLQGDWTKVVAGTVLGGALGRFLYQRNFELSVIMPAVYGDRKKFTPEIRSHYAHTQEDKVARDAMWVFARELLGSGDWFDSLWAKREAISQKPALILWGLKDRVFGASYRKRWEGLFDHATVKTFPDAGHFVQEEEGASLVPIIADFLKSNPIAE